MATPRLTLDQMKEAFQVYEACEQNITTAADKLGIPRGTLQHRLKQYQQHLAFNMTNSVPGQNIDEPRRSRINQFPEIGEEDLQAVVDAVAKYGSQRAAAEALGLSRHQVALRLQRAHRKGVSNGIPVHEGMLLKSASTLYDGETGSKKLIWVKEDVEMQERLDRLKAAVEGMMGDLPRAAPITAPTSVKEKLLNLYTFSDYHLGMLSWPKETGHEWNVQIAEDMGAAAMQAMVDMAPAAKVGVINLQGDFLHFDGLVPVTPTHGHVLDADSRFGKVIEVAIRMVRKLVACALTRHEKVILVVAEGNHDIVGALWLRKLFGVLYENEPRVKVNDSEIPYYAIAWGNTFLGIHHGHLKKNESLPMVFATMFREMWGRCKKVYIHTGHRHHLIDEEKTGCRMIQHPTIAAPDAHSARGAWLSGRGLVPISYHRDFGQVWSSELTPEMLA